MAEEEERLCCVQYWPLGSLAGLVLSRNERFVIIFALDSVLSRCDRSLRGNNSEL